MLIVILRTCSDAVHSSNDFVICEQSQDPAHPLKLPHCMSGLGGGDNLPAADVIKDM